jgi:hypothetical protein
MIFSFLSPIWKYLGEAFVPESSLVLNILREGLDFVEAGRPFRELGWEPLYKRREKQKLILLYKIINGLTPDYMYDMIQPYTENIHDYNLRQQELNHLLFNRVKSTFVSLFFYKGVPSQVHYIV